MPELVLYHKPGCPYCIKVIDFLEKKGVKIPWKNITENAEIMEELISLSGKKQVPCLVIDGKAMLESDDIIKWIDEHYPTD